MSIINEIHDIRRELVGGYAAPVGPDAPIRTFASGVLLRRQAPGSFVSDPDLHRQGTFADVDRG